jgi:HD-GYP domain-containing protein (c-di-GMP phosphodiesterase class II)
VSERVYEGLFDHLTEVMLRLVRGELHFLEETQAEVERTLSRLSEDAASVFDTIQRETSRSDVFQFRHSIRVGCLALEFARALTDDRELLLRLGTAALLHDVGKRDVPPEVLRHPGRLSGEMLEAMRQHPRYGARLLLRMPDSDPLAVAIAFCHHRRSDGGGYPESVDLAELSLATHVVKICDVYEALTAERPYKPRMTPRRAYRVMIGMSGQLDPALLHRFIDVVGVWPVGERVRLRSGAVGRVVAQTGCHDRPVIRLEGERDPVDLRGARGDDLGPVAGCPVEHPEEQPVS